MPATCGICRRLPSNTAFRCIWIQRHGFGCAIAGRPIGSFGAIEIISFHSDNILGACEGGVVCTQNDDLGAHIRNTRSSYGMGPPVPVIKTAQRTDVGSAGRRCTFQPGPLPEYQNITRTLFKVIQSGCSGIPGLQVRVPNGVDQSNYQNLICLVDEGSFGLGATICGGFCAPRTSLPGKASALPIHRSASERASSLATLARMPSSIVPEPWNSRSNRGLTGSDASETCRSARVYTARCRRHPAPARRGGMKLAIMQPYFFPYLGALRTYRAVRKVGRLRYHAIHAEIVDEPQPRASSKGGWNYISVPLANGSISIKTAEAEIQCFPISHRPCWASSPITERRHRFTDRSNV